MLHKAGQHFNIIPQQKFFRQTSVNVSCFICGWERCQHQLLQTICNHTFTCVALQKCKQLKIYLKKKIKTYYQQINMRALSRYTWNYNCHPVLVKHRLKVADTYLTESLVLLGRPPSHKCQHAQESSPTLHVGKSKPSNGVHHAQLNSVIYCPWKSSTTDALNDANVKQYYPSIIHNCLL